MSMRKLLSTPFLIHLLCTQLYGQSVQELSISDKIPDISLHNFLDDPSKSIHLSDLKGKLVIFDFWNVYCSSCIAGMPKMDSLQKQFGADIQIILVTRDSPEAVKRLFSKVAIPKPDLPILVSDTILSRLFPHRGVPLHVWIGRKGEVSAITQAYNTNAENIAKTLAGQTLKLSRRWDYGIDTDHPLLSEQNKTILPLAIYHSMLLQGTEEYSIANAVYVIEDSLLKEPVMIRAINASMLRLYNIAYNRFLYGFNVSVFDLRQNNRILLDVKDPGKFNQPADQDKLAAWIAANQYSYELGVSPSQAKNIFKYMQDDLNRFFNYDAGIKKMKMKCIVLVRTSGKDKIRTTHPLSRASTSINKDNSISICNMPLAASLIKKMIYRNYHLTTPIIDGTGYSGNVDLEINAKLDDLPALKKNLQLYDLDLIEEEREIDMLVIRDKR
jgi:thiol-disulfide isomerase/thioredoxin